MADPIRILALDGAGLSARSQIMILEAMMKAVDPNSPPKPCEYFNLISGASSGGIFALMLGRLRMSIDQCLFAYEKHIKKPFEMARKQSGEFLTLSQKVANSAALRKGIEGMLQSNGYNTNILLMDPSHKACKILVTTRVSNSERSDAQVTLASYPITNPVDSTPLESITVLEAALATSFELSTFQHIKVGEFELYSTWQFNPIDQAWGQARTLWNDNQLRNNLGCLVSVGMGELDNTSGQYRSMVFHPSLMSEGRSSLFRSKLSRLYPEVEKFFYRFNAPHLDLLGIEEDKREDKILAATLSFVESHETIRRIKACINGTLLLPLWDVDNESLNNDADFSNQISCTFHTAVSSFTGSSWHNPPNPKTPISFGDSGVTATLSARGDLIQFSSYLGAGTSGLFSVDQMNMPEPYRVRDRIRRIVSLGTSETESTLKYGLRFPKITANSYPDVSYVHDRWPRFKRSGDSIDMTMQWIVNENVLVQSCSLTNNKDEKNVQPFEFSNGMHIRDLEFIGGRNSFNDLWNGHACRGAPNDYGWILVNPLGPKKEVSNEQEDTESEEDEVYSSTSTSTSESDGGNNENRHNDNKNTNAKVDKKEKYTGSENENKPLPEADPWAVAVLVSIFINGQAQKWEDVPHPLRGKAVEFEVTLEAKSTVEVAIAYKTILLPAERNGNWVDFLISPSVANVQKFLSEEEMEFEPFYATRALGLREDSPSKFSISGLPSTSMSWASHIDFIIRRNLEHILSTCSIPINNPGSERAPLIALTCGDISGHRICTSASFFAFNFLLKIVDLLNGTKQDSHKSLRRRIEHVFQGHINWLSQLETGNSGQFAANYWPNGNIIMLPTGSKSFIPENSFVDTAFQLIKASQFEVAYPSQQNHSFIRGLVHTIGHKWIHQLQMEDVRGSFVWPHYTDKGYKKYRLSEQIWIWRAIKTIRSHLKDIPAIITVQRALVESLEPEKIQKAVHQRFITEDIISKKRMFATTRSPRETRFLFHSSDTALFYALDWGFLLKQTWFNEVWENTLRGQLSYRENSEATWEKLNRYGLAVMIGARNLSLNERSPSELLISSLDVLSLATSPSGLFHGRVDITTKEPVIFQNESERDSYFHASFEIPYILLNHIEEILALFKDAPHSPLGANKQFPHPHYNDNRINAENVKIKLTSLPKQRIQADDDAIETGMTQKKQEYGNRIKSALEATIRTKSPDVMAIKKRVPLDGLVDESNIVELEDEWLYNYPSFFKTISIDAYSQGRKVFKTGVQKILEQAKGDTEESAITKAARLVQVLRNAKWGLTNEENIMVWLTNIPKQNLGKKLWRRGRHQNYGVTSKEKSRNDEVWYELYGSRAANTAKKQFIWLAKATRTTALVCVIGSPEDENQAILQFFDRHSQYHDAFLDKVHMSLNIWETELHVSFYRLVSEDYNPELDKCIPTPNASVLPRGSKLKLAQASMGFRFTGDVFDRYWTCHFVEYIPNSTRHLDIHPWDQGNEVVQEQGCWRQRKILELHLFDRILKELVGNTTKIFSQIQTELGIKHGAFSYSISNSDVYFSSSARWQEFQQILHVVEEEISGNLSIIDQWEARARQRVQQPRWTRNDERKYRAAINRLERMNRGRIGELRKCHGNVKSLRETLVQRQEQIRNDLGLRGAENIRFFTYVTVVFLPLGFAASIFSMNGAPPSDVVKSMTIFAAIALLITVVALMNAKRVNSIIEGIKRLLETLSIRKINDSPLYDSYETRKVKREDLARRRKDTDLNWKWVTELNFQTFYHSNALYGNSGSDAEQEPPLLKYRHNKIPFHLDFWLGYLFLEFPARQVLMAFDAMTNRDFTNWKSYVYLVTGILLLPIFTMAYVSQTILYNVADLGRLCWKHIKPKKKEDSDTAYLDEAIFKDRLNWLMFPRRPLLELEKDSTVPARES